MLLLVHFKQGARQRRRALVDFLRDRRLFFGGGFLGRRVGDRLCLLSCPDLLAAQGVCNYCPIPPHERDKRGPDQLHETCERHDTYPHGHNTKEHELRDDGEEPYPAYDIAPRHTLNHPSQPESQGNKSRPNSFRRHSNVSRRTLPHPSSSLVLLLTQCIEVMGEKGAEFFILPFHLTCMSPLTTKYKEGSIPDSQDAIFTGFFVAPANAFDFPILPRPLLPS